MTEHNRAFITGAASGLARGGQGQARGAREAAHDFCRQVGQWRQFGAGGVVGAAAGSIENLHWLLCVVTGDQFAP